MEDVGKGNNYQISDRTNNEVSRPIKRRLCSTQSEQAQERIRMGDRNKNNPVYRSDLKL